MRMQSVAACGVALAMQAFAGSLTVGCPTAGLDEFRAVAAFAKSVGATHVDASQVEHSLWQWNANRYDPYPNWSMHRPSIFKFIVPREPRPRRGDLPVAEARAERQQQDGAGTGGHLRRGVPEQVRRLLRRRISLMEAHRRDFLRLYRSYNK